MQIFYVGLGSFAGGVLRFLSFYFLPFGILGNLLWVNVLGSVCIGFLSQILVSQEMRLVFIMGFLGSFTTFSTFSLELFELFSSQKLLLAFLYLVASVILGVLGVWGGIILFRWIL
ncbi:fluoride efflux transporter FluC [Helicobacter pametensis]|uniref:fluoride efflux transporter FluC n=1 Tax=Helicobacter pametensis TaxID=95149 RepID=UPI0013156DD2|nr:CrcB family protein [Helicobacter pametensis]